MCLQELISQYGPPAPLYTDNGPLFASHEFAQFLQHHHRDHITSFTHFPQSNGFTECQVCNIKTILSTSQDFRKNIKDLILGLCSTPIWSNMPSSWEIQHDRTFQHPGRSSTQVDMESVRNYLLSRKQSQKAQFNRAHGTFELQDLGPDQEVLFRSPGEDEYIPRPLLTGLPCHAVTLWRPKANDTAEKGNI